jgi:hypothetical protein
MKKQKRFLSVRNKKQIIDFLKVTKTAELQVRPTTTHL